MTVSRSWLADCPAWEKREVNRHYKPDEDLLVSEFLPHPISYSEALCRRQRGEPLEYILHHCHIGPLTLKVDRRALIPRQETETLLKLFKGEFPALPAGPLVDCGTGSGFIAAWLKINTSRRVVATDVDQEALSLAAENFQYNDLQVDILQMDRLNGLAGELAGIVANLPYVLSGDDKLQRNVKEYEPDRALFVPGAPLEFYGKFFHQAANKLRPEGQLWLEATPELIQKFMNYLQDCNLEVKFSPHNDLTNRLRYLQLINLD
ncbi:MAG: N5-glutamine methyltransferase family protein [bacterium]